MARQEAEASVRSFPGEFEGIIEPHPLLTEVFARRDALGTRLGEILETYDSARGDIDAMLTPFPWEAEAVEAPPVETAFRLRHERLGVLKRELRAVLTELARESSWQQHCMREHRASIAEIQRAYRERRREALEAQKKTREIEAYVAEAVGPEHAKAEEAIKGLVTFVDTTRDVTIMLPTPIEALGPPVHPAYVTEEHARRLFAVKAPAVLPKRPLVRTRLRKIMVPAEKPSVVAPPPVPAPPPARRAPPPPAPAAAAPPPPPPVPIRVVAAEVPPAVVPVAPAVVPVAPAAVRTVVIPMPKRERRIRIPKQKMSAAKAAMLLAQHVPKLPRKEFPVKGPVGAPPLAKLKIPPAPLSKKVGPKFPPVKPGLTVVPPKPRELAAVPPPLKTVPARKPSPIVKWAKKPVTKQLVKPPPPSAPIGVTITKPEEGIKPAGVVSPKKPPGRPFVPRWKALDKGTSTAAQGQPAPAGPAPAIIPRMPPKKPVVAPTTKVLSPKGQKLAAPMVALQSPQPALAAAEAKAAPGRSVPGILLTTASGAKKDIMHRRRRSEGERVVEAGVV